MGLISVSDSQRSPLPELNWLATCHNAIAMDSYPFHPDNDGYLLFLGRMSPDKGAHHAVALARETGLPMILAGKMQDVEERHHFEANVKPLLGGNIEYVGEVSHDEKVRLLQNARATVFPIQWPEPFGLVMVESMACGTPVVATRLGAVPEVIEQGRSGIIVDSPAELAAAVEQAMHARSGRVPGERDRALLARADGGRLRRRLPPPDGLTTAERPARRRPRPAGCRQVSPT